MNTSAVVPVPLAYVAVALLDRARVGVPDTTTASSQVTVIEIASPTNSRNFDLPEHYKNQLLVALAKFIGVSLRDEFLLTKTA